MNGPAWCLLRTLGTAGADQVGDMEFVRGIDANRNHAVNSNDLPPFEAAEKGNPVRFNE